MAASEPRFTRNIVSTGLLATAVALLILMAPGELNEHPVWLTISGAGGKVAAVGAALAGALCVAGLMLTDGPARRMAYAARRGGPRR